MNLYAECRAARREKRFTPRLMAALMDACGRPTMAATWRRIPEQDEPLKEQPKMTGLEYFIREAKSKRAARLREANRTLAQGELKLDPVEQHVAGFVARGPE